MFYLMTGAVLALLAIFGFSVLRRHYAIAWGGAAFFFALASVGHALWPSWFWAIPIAYIAYANAANVLGVKGAYYALMGGAWEHAQVTPAEYFRDRYPKNCIETALRMAEEETSRRLKKTLIEMQYGNTPEEQAEALRARLNKIDRFLAGQGLTEELREEDREALSLERDIKRQALEDVLAGRPLGG